MAGEASWSGGVVWLEWGVGVGVGSGSGGVVWLGWEWGVGVGRARHFSSAEELTCRGVGEKLENWRVTLWQG